MERTLTLALRNYFWKQYINNNDDIALEHVNALDAEIKAEVKKEADEAAEILNAKYEFSRS